MKSFVAVIAVAFVNSTNAADSGNEVLASCVLGKARKLVVEVLASDRVGNTFTVHLRTAHHDGTATLFPAGEQDESRGTSVRIQCEGRKEKVLVITGEFYGSGYPRGLVLRYNGEKLQRLEFAERSPPRFLYLMPRRMALYVPQPYPDREQGWTVYRYNAKQGQVSDQAFATKLPGTGSGQKITLQ
jgi:hypothetical protein